MISQEFMSQGKQVDRVTLRRVAIEFLPPHVLRQDPFDTFAGPALTATMIAERRTNTSNSVSVRILGLGSRSFRLDVYILFNFGRNGTLFESYQKRYTVFPNLTHIHYCGIPTAEDGDHR